MALRAVLEHPKFAALKVRLGLRKCEALGYLEGLWHFCGRFTPQGNIGKYSDLQIESWLEWSGAQGVLIAALVAEKWIDECSESRLIVHDWDTHADKATKQALTRAELAFLRPVCVHRGHAGPDFELMKTESASSVAHSSDLSTLPVPVPVPVAVAVAVPVPVSVPGKTEISEKQQQSTATPPLKARSTFSEPKKKPLPPPKGMDEFRELMESTGKPLNEQDFAAVAMESVTKDMGDAYFRDVVIPYVKENLAKWRDELNKDFVPFPVNLLKKTPWTRTAKALGKSDDEPYCIPKDRLYDPAPYKARLAQIAREAAEDAEAAKKEEHST